MRSNGVLGALVALAGCTVAQPDASIDYDNGYTPPETCTKTAGFCHTVDASCEVVLATGCTVQSLQQQGLCARNQQFCDSTGTCQPDPDNFVPVEREVCDGLDDNCNGTVDDGCDADHDGHCAVDAIVVGLPAACAEGPIGYGDDCDDWNVRRTPGVPEICYDGIDNNCDGQIDEGCPVSSLSIAKPAVPIVMHPGEQRLLAFLLSPVVNGATPAPTVDVKASSDACGAQSFGAYASAGTPQLRLSAPTSPGANGCQYAVTLGVSGASDSVTVVIEDRPPVIQYVTPARFDGTAWSATGIHGESLDLRVVATEPDGQMMSISWTDGGGTQVCGADYCQVSIPSTGTGGELTVTVSDGTTPVTVKVKVAYDGCVWVRNGFVGGDGLSKTTPFGVLDQNVVAAAWEASVVSSTPTDVCILSTGGSFSDVALTLDPSSHTGVHQPSLIGIVASGQLPVLSNSVDTPIEIANGYTGIVANLEIDATGAPSAVAVADASPLLAGCTLKASAPSTGTTVVGLDVTASTAPTSPVVIGGSISAKGGSASGIGVRATNSGSAPVQLVLRGLGEISASSAALNAVAIQLAAGASMSASILDNTTIRADAGDGPGSTLAAAGLDIIAIEAVSAGSPPSLDIERNGTIAAASGTGLTAAIRLAGAARATITENQRIATEGFAGQFVAAILDGEAGVANGTLALSPGGSSGIEIARNDLVSDEAQISGCSVACDCVAPLLKAAVVLAGSVNPSVASNGRDAILRNLSPSAHGGILGGAGVPETGATTDPASAVPTGLWLVDAIGASVTGNEIRAGTYVPACAPTPSFTVAYRDSASGPAQTESRTVFDGNGASCALAASMQTTATPDDPPCVAVLVDGTSAGMGPLITNSVLSANRGAEETALWIQGPAVTRAYNDLFDVGTPPDPAFEPTRKAVRLDYVADGGVELVNDIFLVHGTPPATDDGSALALREYETDCGSHLAAFEYNLLFFEGDVLDTSWDPQYVQVGTPSYPVGWHSGDINFLIPEHGRHNVPADPVLVMPADPWLRFQTRLSAVSPARDRGVVQEGIPTKDIDGDDRVPEVCAGCSTAAIDIGHDEYMP